MRRKKEEDKRTQRRTEGKLIADRSSFYGTRNHETGLQTVCKALQSEFSKIQYSLKAIPIIQIIH